MSTMSTTTQSNNVQTHHHHHHHRRHHHRHHEKKTSSESDSSSRIGKGVTDQLGKGNEVPFCPSPCQDSYNMRHLSETVILRVPVSSQPSKPEPPSSPSPSISASIPESISIAPVSDSDSSDAEQPGLNNKLIAPPSPSRCV